MTEEFNFVYNGKDFIIGIDQDTSSWIKEVNRGTDVAYMRMIASFSANFIHKQIIVQIQRWILDQNNNPIPSTSNGRSDGYKRESAEYYQFDSMAMDWEDRHKQIINGLLNSLGVPRTFGYDGVFYQPITYTNTVTPCTVNYTGTIGEEDYEETSLQNGSYEFHLNEYDDQYTIEYSIDGGLSWQEGSLFEGFDEDFTVSPVIRYKDTVYTYVDGQPVAYRSTGNAEVIIQRELVDNN